MRSFALIEDLTGFKKGEKSLPCYGDYTLFPANGMVNVAHIAFGGMARSNSPDTAFSL